MQTKNCWQNWVDFHKCTAARGEDFPVCQKFKKVYRSLCPNEWVRRRKNPRPPFGPGHAVREVREALTQLDGLYRF